MDLRAPNLPALGGDALENAHRAFRGWMLDAALPFWAGPGRDGPGLGVRESLTATGAPSGAPFKRMRVQARQIYAFSHAALLGWADGEEVARDAYRFILRAGRRADGGWVRRLDPTGAVVLDATADLYDQAFVLFALAWYARATGQTAPLEQARATAEWLRAAMRGPGPHPDGYLNALPEEGGLRQQNPHMHLLEAALALLETSGDAYWADWAHELVALFERRLFDEPTGTLGEFFAADWGPAPGAAGDHVEPGHHYEWAWLLHQYGRLTGRDRTALAGRLYRFAETYGCDPATGLVWDVVGRDGTPHSRATRLWPQTEALKAHCAMAGLEQSGEEGRGGEGGAAAKIAGIVGQLMARFLAACPHGAWRDRFDAAGSPTGEGIPTSSFYHVFMAYAELDALMARRGGAGRRRSLGGCSLGE